ncbi:hypothetical protein [Vibrio sp. WXL103]|uniref:hypothetical protein n=1 Tax=unclassified Vibrio TaxID=2614977 RepID=UPI003EC866E7
MKQWFINLICLSFIAFSFHSSASVESRPDFDPKADLLLLQFDSNPDADDIMSIAAVGSMLKKLEPSNIDYLAVAGAYGRQGKLYIPSPELFNLVFSDNWVDAHENKPKAAQAIHAKAKQTISAGGNVWVMEAGQSDVSAAWVALLQEHLSPAELKAHVHIVQHSDWNEEQTTPADLAFVKQHISYHRIEDGNVRTNSTAGFYEVNAKFVEVIKSNPVHGESWKLAFDIAHEYNGLDGRYLNPMIAKENGVDFSDVAELIWILKLDQINDVDDFATWLDIY